MGRAMALEKIRPYAKAIIMARQARVHFIAPVKRMSERLLREFQRPHEVELLDETLFFGLDHGREMIGSRRTTQLCAAGAICDQQAIGCT